MDTVKCEFNNIPSHLILSGKVYKLSAKSAKNNSRAFDRDLVDFRVDGINPINPEEDKWHTLLGVSVDVCDDYPSYKLKVPLEWLLFRFLCHHLRTNSLHILSGPGGEVFKPTDIQSFLGNTIDDDQAEEVLRTVLASWVRTFPRKKVELPDLYASTDMSLDTLRRALNSLSLKTTS